MLQQRFVETENSSFTPIVFTSTGGMSKECATFYTILPDLYR